MNSQASQQKCLRPTCAAHSHSPIPASNVSKLHIALSCAICNVSYLELYSTCHTAHVCRFVSRGASSHAAQQSTQKWLTGKHVSWCEPPQTNWQVAGTDQPGRQTGDYLQEAASLGGLCCVGVLTQCMSMLPRHCLQGWLPHNPYFSIAMACSRHHVLVQYWSISDASNPTVKAC